MPTPIPITVVGIGADGADSLSPTARQEILDAEVVIGSERQLRSVDGLGAGERVLLPAPLVPALDDLLDTHADRRVVVLASGDPLFHGIGATLVRLRGRAAVRVLPSPSSVSLAAARLGWSLPDVAIVSAVGRPLAVLNAAVQPGRRILVLTTTADAGSQVRAVLRARGYAASEVTVLASLGGPDESVTRASDGDHDPLAVIAIECVPDAGTEARSTAASLPDDAFEHDGQLTKQEVRAVTLAALQPYPGALLWDVGAGSGSVGIEWMRSHPSCRAVAVESHPERVDRIARNAERLGVPGLRIVAGRAPDVLAGLPAPDAIFVGGAVSATGVLETCADALRPGGRLVANGVTLETETVLARWFADRGGSLTRVQVQRASPVGGFTGWRPAMPVTQWSWTRP